MTFNSSRVRAVLLPLLVAALCIAGLGWYGLVRIPARQTYLNERNLRALRNRSAQLKAKVDNFDGAIDHALDSFKVREGGRGPDGLREYVALFAPDLEILRMEDLRTASAVEENNGSLESNVLERAGDPPRVKVQRDEGKSYLYIGSKPDHGSGQGVAVVARTNLEALAASYLETGADFDAVLLAASDGLVLAEQSPAGLALTRLNTLFDASRAAVKEGEARATIPFESLRRSSSVADVAIGDVAYKLYMQPVQLSLISLTSEATAKKSHESFSPEEWVLCALVRTDRFRAESAAISYAWVLLFSAALAAIWLGIPLVKLRVLAPRERLRAGDAVWLSVTTFLVAGLLTMGVMDLYVFQREFSNVVETRLEAIARSVSDSLTVEVQAIWTQMEALDRQAAREEAVESSENARDGSRRILVDPGHEHLKGGRHVHCAPEAACATQLIGERNTLDYPYFDMAAWNADDGAQLVKWSTGPGVTPFINLKEEDVPYFDQLQRAWDLDDAPKKGVSVFQSPNTGDRITVFWRALAALPARPHRLGQSLTMDSPVALDQPLLPRGFRLAVLDREGKVLFHSDGTRSIEESFFKECEDDPELRAAVLGKYNAHLTTYYRGRQQQMFVTPLLSTDPGLDLGWTLAIFQDSSIADTVNLETVTLAAILFSIFGLFMAVIAWQLHNWAPERWTKWFWPVPDRQHAYKTASAVNLGAIALFLILYRVLPTAPWLLVAAVVIALAAAVATHLIVTPDVPQRAGIGSPETLANEPVGSWQMFHLARATFLFAFAAVPAIACFQCAYEFETKLLEVSEQIHLKSDLAARKSRIDKRAIERLALADPEPFVAARQNTTWDIDTPALSAGGTANGRTPLDTALTWMNRPYNDVAVDLKAAAGRRDGTERGLRAVPVALIAGMSALLLGAFFALLRWLVHPVFAAEASAAALRKTLKDESSTRLLIVGPPGSGKTSRLARHPRIRIFDLRTLAYAERRSEKRTVNVERRAASMGSFARVVGGIGVHGYAWPGAEMEEEPAPRIPDDDDPSEWGEAFDYSALKTEGISGIGLDHFDFRLEDPEMRRQTLEVLERLVYREKYTVILAADRDPLTCITSAVEESGQPESEVYRWVRVLESFRKEYSGIGDELSESRLKALENKVGTSRVGRALIEEGWRSPQLMKVAEDLVETRDLTDWPTVDDVRHEFGVAADEYYRAIWSAATIDERLTLRQLAEEDLVNPRNQEVVQRLMRWGVIVRARGLRLMNITFRRFVQQAAPAEEVSTWERRGIQLPWASVETAMITIVFGLAALLVVTQDQLLGAWIGFVPTLAPAVPTAWKLFARAKDAAKGGTVFEGD